MINSEKTTYLLTHILDNKNINILLLGNTIHQTKKAYEIKMLLNDHGFSNVYCVDKEYESINSTPMDFELTIFCMNPNKLNSILQKTKLCNFGLILIQPNSANEETILFLNDHNLNFQQGCIIDYYRYFK